MYLKNMMMLSVFQAFHYTRDDYGTAEMVFCPKLFALKILPFHFRFEGAKHSLGPG